MGKFNRTTKVFIFYFIYICVLIILFNFKIVNNNLMVIAWISNVTYIVYIVSTIILKRDWLNANIVLMTFIFLFCNGQIFLYSIGVNTSKMIVFLANTEPEIIRASTYFLFSYIIMGMGLNIVNKKYDYKYRINDNYNAAIKSVAIFICITSGIIYLFITVPKFFIALKSGYGALYSLEDSSNLNFIGYYSKFFIPSLLLLIYCYRDNKWIRNLLTGFCLFLACCLLLIGGRGDPIAIVVILIVIYGKYIKKYVLKDFVFFIVLLLIMSIVIPFMANYRSNRSDGIENTLNNVLEDDNNPLTQTIAELGATMNAWCLTDKAVPTLHNYGYGSSYIASVGMLVPSFMLGGISVAQYAALDIWLQNIWDLSYGPGFNIFAETYYNFGWNYGIIFAFCVGYIFGRVFNISSKEQNKDKDSLFSVLSLIFLFNEMLIARFPFHNTLRNFIYMYGLIYLMVNIIYRTRTNKFKS